MGPGASTAIHRFDYARWCEQIAPAFIELLTAAPPGAALPALVANATNALDASEVLALSGGLALEGFGNCETIGPDLGLRDEDLWLLRAEPSEVGACSARHCACRERCPLHRRTHAAVSATTLRALVLAALTTCLGESRELGVSRAWPAFLEWRALEREPFDPGWLDWDSARLLTELCDDVLLGLLLRLAKRGTPLLDSCGGGVLGWLTPRETSALHRSLAAALHATADGVPASLARYSAYAAETELPEARRAMTRLLHVASEAAQRHEGVALSRQL